MDEDEEVARLKSEVKQVVANVVSFHQVSSEWSVDNKSWNESLFRWRRQYVNWATKTEGGKIIFTFILIRMIFC